MRILLMNQFFWPDSSATSQLLTDLARELAGDGHEVFAICADGEYAVADRGNAPAVTVRRVKALPFVRGGVGRMLSYLSFYLGAAYWALMLPRPDVVVTLTTPPLLALLGTMVKKMRGARHFIWEMDMYPDVAVDLEYFKAGSAVVRITGAIADYARGSADGVIALGDCMQDRLARRGVAKEKIFVKELGPEVEEWLRAQATVSAFPEPGRLLVETFPRSNRFFMVVYGFAGRNAHQTLGLLLTRRMLRMKYKPLGFVAGDYAVAVWSGEEPTDIDGLLDQDMLGDDLEEWITESNMMKRLFRNVAVIAGLIERKNPGAEKNGRQVTFNSGIIYDVLRRHEPNHILLRATRTDAAGGLIDLKRLAGMLQEVQGKIDHRRLERVSPLAVPVMLSIGKESVGQALIDELLDDAGESLIAEAMQAGKA